MSALAVQYDRDGIFLPAIGLWLDAREPKSEPVFISHAHFDHLAQHPEVILSEPTSRLMHARLRSDRKERILAFHQPEQFTGNQGTCTLTLLPAGHIFGSAMLLVESAGERLLYTGDFKLRPGLSAERCQPQPADVLIMETTYGRPEYRFPPPNEIIRNVIRFCRETIDNDEIPVLLGYSLGKSQELLCGLSDAGLPLMLHEQVYQLTEIYKSFGHCFPAYEKIQKDRARGKVLVCPPQSSASTLIRNLAPVRTAVLTGWAMDPHCRFRYQTDAAFPLSDHADFPELIQMVQQVRPKTIYTVHGFTSEFAQTLRELGHDAHALGKVEQLSLPLSEAPAAPVLREVSSRELPISHPVPTPAETIGHSFHAFANTCVSIGSTPKKLEKIRILADYLVTLDPASLAPVNSWFTGHPFPPSQGKVLRLGWAIIRDALCDVAGIDHAGFGQVYLKHSDLGETAFEILSHRPELQPSVTVRDVDQLFQRVYAARGPLGKLPLLSSALRQCTALEGKYVVKILTGELRIGLKEGLVEEAVARAFQTPIDEVKYANLLLGDIGETAELARRGELSSATLVPFRPIKFMLASPEETAAELWKRVSQWSPASATDDSHSADASSRTVWIEDKYDGIRCQMHKVGQRVALYSRDLKEITSAFQEVADLARRCSADFVVDGEILAMRDAAALPFAELQKRLGRRERDLFLGEEIPVQFIAFDLLWLDGSSILNRPLRERRNRLDKLGAFQSSRITYATSADEIETAFSDAKKRGNEGLMIKDPSSTYTPGRRGLAWLKLKKAHGTLDCVVVGAEYGHGKRKAVLSDYTFAVRDDATGQLRTIGKAFTGLTDSEIAELTQHFLKKRIRQHGRYFEVEPDTVLEIAFDAIQVSDRHTSGLAMRFPRIVRIRRDKSPADIDLLSAARQFLPNNR